MLYIFTCAYIIYRITFFYILNPTTESLGHRNEESEQFKCSGVRPVYVQYYWTTHQANKENRDSKTKKNILSNKIDKTPNKTPCQKYSKEYIRVSIIEKRLIFLQLNLCFAKINSHKLFRKSYINVLHAEHHIYL